MGRIYAIYQVIHNRNAQLIAIHYYMSMNHILCFIFYFTFVVYLNRVELLCTYKFIVYINGIHLNFVLCFIVFCLFI